MASSVVSTSTLCCSSWFTQSEYFDSSTMLLGSVSPWSRTRWIGVEPVTEQTFLPLRVFLPVIELSSLRTSRLWPATKYGPAKDTCALRLALIVYDATTRSTWPLPSAASRAADWIGVNLIRSVLRPSLAATSLAISMSNPLYSPVIGSLMPMPGWSSFTPTVIVPLRRIRSKVADPGTDTPLATPIDSVVVGGAPVPELVGVPPHAASARPPTS